jgi:hypothetical protein
MNDFNDITPWNEYLNDIKSITIDSIFIDF